MHACQTNCLIYWLSSGRLRNGNSQVKHSWPWNLWFGFLIELVQYLLAIIRKTYFNTIFPPQFLSSKEPISQILPQQLLYVQMCVCVCVCVSCFLLRQIASTSEQYPEEQLHQIFWCIFLANFPSSGKNVFLKVPRHLFMAVHFNPWPICTNLVCTLFYWSPI